MGGFLFLASKRTASPEIFSSLVPFESQILSGDFVPVDMSNVVDESPEDIPLAVHEIVLGTEVSRIEFLEFLKVSKDLVKVDFDGSRCRGVLSLEDLSSLEVVEQLEEQGPILALIWQFSGFPRLEMLHVA